MISRILQGADKELTPCEMTVLTFREEGYLVIEEDEYIVMRNPQNGWLEYVRPDGSSISFVQMEITQ